MIIDLDPLPYRTALNLIKMCVEYDIDTQKCKELLDSMLINPVPDIEWKLDIPEKYVTFFFMKNL